MKTLIILSAFLLVLSSCNKEMPCPGSDPDPAYVPDPYSDPAPPADPGDDDPPPCGDNYHPAGTVPWMQAAPFHPGA